MKVEEIIKKMKEWKINREGRKKEFKKNYKKRKKEK